jgi:transcriptional regulator with XRE-family HTH domain
MAAPAPKSAGRVLKQSCDGMIRVMLGARIRDARHAAGLTQQRLAGLADVPRSQLQKLEKDENVTVETLRAIVRHLPALRWLKLALDGEDVLAVADPAVVRQALAELTAATGRLSAAFGVAAPTTQNAPAGATRVEDPPFIDDDLMRRIKQIDAAIDAGEVQIEDIKDHS